MKVKQTGAPRRVALVVLLLVLANAPLYAQSGVPSAEEARVMLAEMQELMQAALAESRAAEQAPSVEAVKVHADAVFTLVWGLPSGLAAPGATGAETVPGWKTRWQVNGSEFDEAFVARYGARPPEIGDPRRLGIVGRGLAVRKRLQAIADENAGTASGERAAGAVAALSNVIGWMRIDDGVTKGERQPRVDLTYQWDAPAAFWNSSADTGWLHEAYAQAVNMLKTDYAGDVQQARRHAAGMTSLLEKALAGLDVNGDGSVSPVAMEGGLALAAAEAEKAGL